MQHMGHQFEFWRILECAKIATRSASLYQRSTMWRSLWGIEFGFTTSRMDHVRARITGDSWDMITCDAVLKDPAAVPFDAPLQAPKRTWMPCPKIMITKITWRSLTGGCLACWVRWFCSPCLSLVRYWPGAGSIGLHCLVIYWQHEVIVHKSQQKVNTVWK